MPVPPTAAARTTLTPTPTLAPLPTPAAPRPGAADQVGDIVRWAAFCCVLVPVVLAVQGTSPAGAVGAALGLAAVTAVCRLLLRRSERGLRAEERGLRAETSRGGPRG